MSDFVNFNLAKKLKEKGFKLACIGHYEGDRFEYNTYDGYDINISYIARSYNDDDRFEKYTDVPVICQVLKWLREDKKIHVTTGVTPKSSWRYIIMFCDERGLKEPTITEKNHQDYHSAIIAGIEYVLDNLI